MKLAIPDMISPSYFPAIAAAELGLFRREGLDLEVVLLAPADRAYQALADGSVALVGAEAHAGLAAFPEWRGMKLIAAQSQGMYWFLVMRRDLGGVRGGLDIVRGRRIAAAPWVELGLKRLLVEAGIDPLRDAVEIVPIPGTQGPKVNIGVTAAQALADGAIDGFWANAMGAAVAVSQGVGTVILDVRRGDGPPACFHYTWPALAVSDQLIAEAPERAAGAVRSLVAAQAALKADPGIAADIGRRLFPDREARMIADLIRRDLPYYDATISLASVDAMNQFARDMGILDGRPDYADVVATQFSPLWTGRRPP